MPDFPVSYAPGYAEILAVATCTAAATDHTKGAWAQVTASTARDYDALLIALNVNSNAIGELFDIGVGGAGAEQVVVPDLLFAGLDRHALYFLAPVAVPAGSRIAARMQATNAGAGTTTGQVAVMGICGSFLSTPSAARIITLGITTASTKGTTLDAGASAGTYGAWTELAASSSADIAALALVAGNLQNTTPTDLGLSTNSGLQLGVGGAGVETVICDGVPYTTSDTSQYGPLPGIWFPCSIPAGSRIAARIKMNTTDATDRKLDLAAYALVI